MTSALNFFPSSKANRQTENVTWVHKYTFICPGCDHVKGVITGNGGPRCSRGFPVLGSPFEWLADLLWFSSLSSTLTLLPQKLIIVLAWGGVPWKWEWGGQAAGALWLCSYVGSQVTLMVESRTDTLLSLSCIFTYHCHSYVLLRVLLLLKHALYILAQLT